MAYGYPSLFIQNWRTMPSEKILVIGLGNPILGDDGVGWVVVDKVEAHLAGSRVDAEFDRLALGGLSLMERLVDYRHIILIDSLCTNKHSQGAVVTFTLDDMIDLTSGHTSAAHDTSLKTALATGRQLGASLPKDKDIHVVAIESEHVYEIGEGLTPPIASAVPVAVQKVLELLTEIKKNQI
jgi:hydrogenase maturation protease